MENYKTRANYLRIALNLQNIHITNEIAEQVWLTIDRINEKGGEFSLQDAVDIMEEVEKIKANRIPRERARPDVKDEPDII